MSAIAVILLAGGAYLMYYAVRNQTPHPIAHAQTQIKKLGSSS